MWLNCGMTRSRKIAESPSVAGEIKHHAMFAEVSQYKSLVVVSDFDI